MTDTKTINSIPLEPEYQAIFERLVAARGVSKVQLVRDMLRAQEQPTEGLTYAGNITVPGGESVPIYTMYMPKKRGKQ